MSTTELKPSDSPALEEVQETYHIFDYMKEHTAFFVACVSGSIAVISFILSLATFAYERLQLRIWDVDIQLVNLTTGGKPYYFIFSNFIYCIAFTLLAGKFERLFQRHFHDISPLIYLRKLWKTISKLNKAQKRDIRRLMRKAKWKKLFSSDKSEAYEELARLGSLSKNIEIIDLNQTDATKSIRHMRRKLAKSLLIELFLTAIFLLLPLVLFVSCLSGDLMLHGVIVLWLLIFALTCFLSARSAKRKEPAYKSKYIKQKAAEAVQQQIFSNTPAIEEYPVPKIPSMTPKYFFCDKNLKDLSYSFLAGFLSLFLIMILSGATSKTQKAFWIYTDKSQLYAVVYQDASSCILKEANVDGDILTINTSNQLIVDSKSIRTHKETFSKVIRIAE